MKCKLCGKFEPNKAKLIDHIDTAHTMQIPEGMDAFQFTYYLDHKTIKGKCMICNSDTEWNDKTNKPFKICNNPKCKETARERAVANMIKVYNKSTLLDDPNHQKKMMKNRKIYGEYKFTDGGKVGYESQLSKKFLEFLDHVMEFSSKMVLETDINFPYIDKDGKTRNYIIDYYLPDYNLIVEVKEGGDNPNLNPAYIEETKSKEKFKDGALRLQKEYNVVKVINNDFATFIQTLYLIKMEMIKPENEKKKQIINLGYGLVESVGNLDSKNTYAIIISPKNINMVESVGLSDTIDLSNIYLPEGNGFKNTNIDDDVFKNKRVRVVQYTGDSTLDHIFSKLQVEFGEDEVPEESMFDILKENNINLYVDDYYNNCELNENAFIDLIEFDSVKSFKKFIVENAWRF